MALSLSVDLCTHQHPLHQITPHVQFILDKVLAEQSLSTHMLEILYILLSHASTYSAHCMFDIVFALRRTSRVFWKLFFSAKGPNVPTPPATSTTDLENSLWGMSLYIGETSTGLGSEYAAWWYYLIACRYSNAMAYDMLGITGIYERDDLFALRMLVESRAFCFPDDSAISEARLFEFKAMPKKCLQYMLTPSFNGLLRHLQAEIKTRLRKTLGWTWTKLCKTLADCMLYHRLDIIQNDICDIFLENTALPVTEELLNYITRDELTSLLIEDRPDVDDLHNFITRCRLYLGSSRYRSGNILTMIEALFALLQKPVPLSYTHGLFASEIPITTTALKTEPIWSLAMCKSMSICLQPDKKNFIILVLFALHSVCRHIAKPGNPLQSTIHDLCWDLVLLLPESAQKLAPDIIETDPTQFYNMAVELTDDHIEFRKPSPKRQKL